MPVRLDKDPVPPKGEPVPSRIPAVPQQGLQRPREEPAVPLATTDPTVFSPIPLESASPVASRAEAEAEAEAEADLLAAAPGPVRRRGRIVAAFLAGCALAGAGAATIVQSLEDDVQRTVSELAVVHEQLISTQDRLTQADSSLAAVQSELAAARGREAGVEARETTLSQQAAELAARTASLDTRQQQLDSEEAELADATAAVTAREAALASPDVDHPLLTFISDDGTWVAGRDVEPGTWSTMASDTGCTWRTADGRRGAGDGSYDLMKVEVLSGQSLTVHGCSHWSKSPF